MKVFLTYYLEREQVLKYLHNTTRLGFLSLKVQS